MPRDRARTTVLRAAGGQVDRESRVIRGLSLITRGEALGHELWIDGKFLDQVAAADVSERGLKARFTHPGLCEDGLGKNLGRVRGLRREGDQVKGDLHLAQYASKSPDGDLAGYVMDMAEEDPEACGLSIVFDRDLDGERSFREACSTEEDGFKSPDERNAKNLRHARLDRLVAADAVDTPAANPAGFFSQAFSGGGEVAARAEAALGFALGLTDIAPDPELLGIDPQRLRRFARGFFQRHGLTLHTPEAERHEEIKMDKKIAELAELRERFGSDPQFVLDQLTAKASLEAAEQAWDKRRADLAEAKAAALEAETKAKIEAAEERARQAEAKLAAGAPPARFLSDAVVSGELQSRGQDDAATEYAELGFATDEDYQAFLRADELGLVRGANL